MAKKESTAVAVTGGTGVAVPMDFGDDAGVNATADSSETKLPFINVLQALSPEVQEGTVEGAKPGMFINSVSKQIYDGDVGVVFIPAWREHVYLEFVPRKQGGGFRGKHAFESDFIKQARETHKKNTESYFGKIPLENRGNDNKENTELTEAFTVFGLLLSSDGSEIMGPCAMTFTSTKIAPWRDWRSTQNSYLHPVGDGTKKNPPLFAHLVRVTTVKQTSKDGPFFNVVLQPALKGQMEGGDIEIPLMPASIIGPTDPRFIAAKEVGKVAKSGEAKVDYNVGESADEDESAPF